MANEILSVKGLAGIGNLSKLGIQINVSTPKNYKTIARKILNMLQANTPYKTGALRASERVEQKGKSELQISVNKIYALPQGLGFRHYRSGKRVPGKFYVKRTLERHQFDITSGINKDIETFIRKALSDKR